jgi:hypothetical protein
MNDLETAAGNTVLIGQIRSFTAWVGDGRKLTQTSRIGLADARHLVELLGTGDTIDPKIGDRVFKIKSSEELGYLTRIVEWAKAARPRCDAFCHGLPNMGRCLPVSRARCSKHRTSAR